eukprot:TRINITY_DN3411_c0_g1_i1.p1 TRINITY_DN3411_c0_g1~~TRINITY_DN3411_c0_g1_i1.p1  ORF type:complete len:454 (+),score=153.58 TRINITY_DN3411_c0_g1_i1:106-1467(+)
MADVYIPEPFHRVPIGSTSGAQSSMSFRELPPLTFTQVIRTCEFYEKKCAGMYSPKSKVARYLFELSREVQQQMRELDKFYLKRMKELRDKCSYYEDVVKEWVVVFGSPLDVDSSDPIGIRTPKALWERLTRSERENAELKEQLKRQREKLAMLEQRVQKESGAQMREMEAEHARELSEREIQWKEREMHLREQFRSEIDALQEKVRLQVHDEAAQKEETLEEYKQSFEDELNKRNLEMHAIVDGMKKEQRDMIGEFRHAEDKMRESIAQRESTLKKEFSLRHAFVVTTMERAINELVRDSLKIAEKWKVMPCSREFMFAISKCVEDLLRESHHFNIESGDREGATRETRDGKDEGKPKYPVSSFECHLRSIQKHLERPITAPPTRKYDDCQKMPKSHFREIGKEKARMTRMSQKRTTNPSLEDLLEDFRWKSKLAKKKADAWEESFMKERQG